MPCEPVRFQLSRRRGFRMADQVANGLPCRAVTRGSRWGNMFVADWMPTAFNNYRLATPLDFSGIGAPWVANRPNVLVYRRAFQAGALNIAARSAAVTLHRAFIAWWRDEDPAAFAAWIAPLRGHNLGCACPLDGHPCHADTLLEMAND